MANLSHPESRRMYSWWWDSHISPKNSKWLQENLTDMDANVKAMIKLLEQDADSFAKRAEMYYKKRPELMKLVEEFYRAYRALAERYDHATGVLRQAHRTMSEAFPNQVPLMLVDDSPGGSASEMDPRTPEMPHPMRAFFEPDDLQKDALGLSSSHLKRNGAHTEEFDSLTNRKGLKQFNDLFGSGENAKLAEGRVRKGLNFHETEEKEQGIRSKENHDLSELVRKFEKEIQTLKEALAKLEAEKEAGLTQYQQSLEKLSQLESEVSRAQEDSEGLKKRANKAEGEVQTLKQALTKLEAEKEASLLLYNQSLERIANLDNAISHAREDAGELNERVHKAETESEALKQDLARVESEKDAALDQYKQSLDIISALESKLLLAEEEAGKLSEIAKKAEKEVETLKQALANLTEEKEAAALQYQQCLETISSLEHKIFCAQAEAQKLNDEIDSGVAKLKVAEEQCLLLERSNQSLHSELESLALKMGAQNEKLTEKQQEVGRLWSCIQEERLRFMEAETAFQTLQHLHAQTQEELRSFASELQTRSQILRDIENRNQSLHEEVLKMKEENKSLNELQLSSAASIKDMQSEIYTLREAKGKLEEEVELRVDQRNALQQEIYCLKEELNELNKKHQAVLDHFEVVGINPDSFVSSIKELRDENLNIKEACEKELREKGALLEKLEVMEQLLEKNAFLEKSLSDLSAELEGARRKIHDLEESVLSLLEEKSTLVAEKAALTTQLHVTTENLEKLSEKNTYLENSLSDAHEELEGLKVTSKSLEDSCQLLENEKSELVNEKSTLVSQMKITQQRLEDFEEKYRALEDLFSALEKEKESKLRELEELQISLDVEKKERLLITEMNEKQLAAMENQIHFLQEEGYRKGRDLEEELDKSMKHQLEIFILRRCVQDVEEKSSSLLIEFQKLLEASRLSEQLISDLEHENLEKQREVKSLSDETSRLRTGVYDLLTAFDIDLDHGYECRMGRGRSYLSHILTKLEDAKRCLHKVSDENQQLAVEKSVLVTFLGQLRLVTATVEMEKKILDQEFRIKNEQFSVLQIEANKLLEMNEKLKLKLEEKDQKEEVMTSEIEKAREMFSDMQGAFQNLQKENLKVIDAKSSLTKEFLDLEEKHCTLEEENLSMMGETICLTNLSLIFKNIFKEKLVELKELSEDLDKLRGVNGVLEDKLRMILGKVEEVELENLHLKEQLKNSEDEVRRVAFVNGELNFEIVNGKDLLNQKEIELSEAKHKLTTADNEKAELQEIVKDLKRENDEVKMVVDDQKTRILKLSEDNDHLSMENGCLREANQELEVELQKLHEEHEKTKSREETLFTEVQNGNNEIDLWEIEATKLFDELQVSIVFQALLRQKVHELVEACKSFEDETIFRGMDIEVMKDKIGTLERENEGLKTQLAAYVPAVNSLKDSVSFLENHSFLHENLPESNNLVIKVAEITSHHHVESLEDQSADQMVPDALSELQNLQTRVETVEKALMERERLMNEENINAKTKLEAALREIEELKSKDGLNQHVKPISEISEVQDGLLTKDIMLDQVSECSSYRIARRERINGDSSRLQSWDSADQVEAVKEQKSKYPNSEAFVEKELSVDKLEISRTFSQPRREVNKGKILERLNSDVQKLTNLQITVHDLKQKVAINEKGPNNKAIVERDTLKGQLEEAEEAIVKLFDVNGKLSKTIEDESFSADGSEGKENVRWRRVSEQARRVSEKIGRLQLDIQKIQFILLKLEDENEKDSRGKTKIADRNRRTLLRDYLYGGGRTGNRRKKAAFCGCVQPPTMGD